MSETTDPGRTLGALLESRASRHDDEDFIHYEGESYTYDHFDSRTNSVANGLLACGISSGDMVALYMYNRLEYLYTLFALAKIGAIAVPIDTRFEDQELAHVLTETDADVVFLDPDTEAEYAAVRDELPTIGAEFYTGGADRSVPYRDFDRLLSGDDTTAPGIEVDGADPCSIVYVRRYRRSHPDGVVLPHYAYVNTAEEASQNLFGLSSEDCIFTTLPLFSIYPIQVGVVGALVAGGEFAFEKQFDKDRFWEWVRQYDASVFLYLGRMLSVLYNQNNEDGDSTNPSSYGFGHGFEFDTDRSLLTDFERRFDVTILEGYGIVASAGLITSNRPDDRRLGSVGKPISYAEVKIVDEDDWEVPTGEAGEIVLRSTRPNTMFREFHADDALTAEVCRNQWIHTNDIGYLDEDGYLHYIEKKSDTIHLARVAGRISSLEIESVIASHSAVEEVVVFGVSTDSGDEAIKAVVVPDDEHVSPTDVSQYCEKQLTYQKLPRFIEIRDELPRSPSGKVRTSQLRTTESSDVWDRESGYELNR